MAKLKTPPLRWLLAVFLIAATTAVAVSVPVIAGSGGAGSTKVIKKVVRANTGLFHSLTGATVPLTPGVPVTTGSLSLPAGRYAVNATVNLGASIPGGNTFGCELRLDGGILDNALWRAPSSGSGSIIITLPLQMAVALKKRSTVTVACRIFDSGGGFATETWITAVRGPTLDGK
jgi:hypothetical protein